ncbi:MAG: GAF domain-containing protein [Acidobacteria bacterium]|nr:GAF domain-containing protein [Acidobacteriota bacterium]
MNTVSLLEIRDCLDGSVPATIATCSEDGTPNVAQLSQGFYVDAKHVALSFQFFNRTRKNILENPRAVIKVSHPSTGAHFVLTLLFVRTESEGPLFEAMRAQLAGIAAHSGMAGVFELKGSDIYRVLHVRKLPGRTMQVPVLQRLSSLRELLAHVCQVTDLASVVDRTVEGLAAYLGFKHVAFFLRDTSGDILTLLASHGYEASGIGAEIRFGQGVIGCAAKHGVPIRINHVTREQAYVHAVKASLSQQAEPTLIPFPGLEQPGSQMAVPVMADDGCTGVLFVEDQAAESFDYQHEEALRSLAEALVWGLKAGMAITPTGPKRAIDPPAVTCAAIRIYLSDHSVFIDDEYLIKGVAGAIFLKLVRSYLESGRCQTTNRALRLDPAIGLPDWSANLETRLLLLQRRLQEKCGFIRLGRPARGRIQLLVERQITLTCVAET